MELKQQKLKAVQLGELYLLIVLHGIETPILH